MVLAGQFGTSSLVSGRNQGPTVVTLKRDIGRFVSEKSDSNPTSTILEADDNGHTRRYSESG